MGGSKLEGAASKILGRATLNAHKKKKPRAFSMLHFPHILFSVTTISPSSIQTDHYPSKCGNMYYFSNTVKTVRFLQPITQA